MHTDKNGCHKCYHAHIILCTYHGYTHVNTVYMNHCTYEQKSQRCFTCKITLGYEERNIERWKTQREERGIQWSEIEREGWENIREREKEKQWPFPDDICTNPVFESLLRTLNVGVWGMLINTRWNAQWPVCICISVHNSVFQINMPACVHIHMSVYANTHLSMQAVA